MVVSAEAHATAQDRHQRCHVRYHTDRGMVVKQSSIAAVRRGFPVIVVNVHLDSAIAKSRDMELARVLIANVGGTSEFGDYTCVSLRGRGTKQLDKIVVNRRGAVKHYPRQREHVLNLVAKALKEMGYG